MISFDTFKKKEKMALIPIDTFKKETNFDNKRRHGKAGTDKDTDTTSARHRHRQTRQGSIGRHRHRQGSIGTRNNGFFREGR